MNIALIIDDPTKVEFLIKELLSDIKKQDDFLGMEVYSGKYKNIETLVLFFKSVQDSITLRAEDLFLFRDLDLIINIGYCYLRDPDLKKLLTGDNVLISEARCNDKYRDLLLLDEGKKKNVSELDDKIRRHLLALAKKNKLNITPVSCYSVWGRSDEIEKAGNCHCIDQKSFALYETAKRYNRNAVCLYKVRNSFNIDVTEYLLDKHAESLDDLIKLSLEFVAKSK